MAEGELGSTAWREDRKQVGVARRVWVGRIWASTLLFLRAREPPLYSVSQLELGSLRAPLLQLGSFTHP